MNFTKTLALVSAGVFSASASASYTQYTVLNSTSGHIDLTFHQIACSEHYIKNIGAFELKADKEKRGICLLYQITGTLNIDGYKIPLKYTSSGTSYGQFVIMAKKTESSWSAKIASAPVMDGYQK